MFLKKIKHLLEAAVAYFFYGLFYVMPIDMASTIAGFIVEKIGVHLSVSKIAYRNLNKCFPNLSHVERKTMVRRMWNHLGRIIGELPHWSRIPRAEFFERVKVKGMMKEWPRNAIYISGHFGNFELASKVSKECALNLHLIHRPANNIFIDNLINNERTKNGVRLFTKGLAGVRQIQKVFRQGGRVGMLVDQKTNDGISVSFFNIAAKTTSLPAKLAIKYNIPLIFVKMLRVEGAYYRVEFSQPLRAKTNDSVTAITEQINHQLERWIRESPEQWFWLHKRW